MSVLQPTLWDNMALENGYHLLSVLRFGEAGVQFEEALNDTGDRQPVLKAMDAVLYWKPRITSLSSTNIPPEKIKNLTDDFISYDFTAQLIGLKKALLIHLVDVIIRERYIELREIHVAFDELLKMNEFQKATALMEYVMEEYPEKKYLFYFLAQAQWLNNDSTKGYGNYIKALLYHPDETFINRVENDKLRALAQSYGMTVAPAYAWIRVAMPFIKPPKDIKPFSEEHQCAVIAYGLLQQSEESLKKDDLKSSVHYRKELKKISPELYEEYFSLLQKRKR